ncbi:MAG: OmpA family protein [Rikenellaceae bacterium]|nr:OmpA family protein [Rikenellaceae bacterium]MCL2693163.1 OmpA family protein [Rikenellaceae bacterium]
MKKLLVLILVAASCASCVSMKRYNLLRAGLLAAETEVDFSRNRIGELISRNDRLAQENERLQAELALLQDKHAELQQRYERLLADGSAEAARMLRQLETNQRELDERSTRVEELERLLRAREEALASIRRKVADALLGFEGKGLSITTRDGKVYVSMDDRLLFRSGSFEVERDGRTAIRDLAAVLAANPEIDIMVEGHTDDVPYRGSGHLRDNLDLSVMRATTVTRLLLENRGIEPSRIISAGRGEWLPVAAGTSADARARNRRTEIILSPKLDELLQLIDRV